MKFRSALLATVNGGLIAGTIDIGAACLINTRSVPFVLQTIAGGLLARAAREGGWHTALLGLALQEGMGMLIASFYVLAASSIASLRRQWIAWGIAYGAVIFIVMNYVVLPLSAWKVVPHFSAWKFVANLAAMFLFGLIVAFFSRGLGREPPEASCS